MKFSLLLWFPQEGSKCLPDVVLRVGGHSEVPDGISGQPLQVGGLGRLGSSLSDGLRDVVAGYGLARERIGELRPGQQLGDGRQLLEVFVVTLD